MIIIKAKHICFFNHFKSIFKVFMALVLVVGVPFFVRNHNLKKKLLTSFSNCSMLF